MYDIKIYRSIDISNSTWKQNVSNMFTIECRDVSNEQAAS